MGIPLSLTVNGKAVEADVDPRTLLVEFLRENLALTGTHVGCDTGAVRRVHRAHRRPRGEGLQRCSPPQAQGCEVTTIEGLAAPTARCTRCRRRSRSATACSAASARRAW